MSYFQQQFCFHRKINTNVSFKYLFFFNCPPKTYWVPILLRLLYPYGYMYRNLPARLQLHTYMLTRILPSLIFQKTNCVITSKYKKQRVNQRNGYLFSRFAKTRILTFGPRTALTFSANPVRRQEATANNKASFLQSIYCIILFIFIHPVIPIHVRVRCPRVRLSGGLCQRVERPRAIRQKVNEALADRRSVAPLQSVSRAAAAESSGPAQGERKKQTLASRCFSGAEVERSRGERVAFFFFL